MEELFVVLYRKPFFTCEYNNHVFIEKILYHIHEKWMILMFPSYFVTSFIMAIPSDITTADRSGSNVLIIISI